MRLCQDKSSQTISTGILVLADGTVFYGEGLGATGNVAAEVCFNTSMTGYQEILTDPSYAGQIITFTFPHIGNVGVNPEDIENISTPATSAARGAIMKAKITTPSNYRGQLDLSSWMKRRGIIGVSGIDTRALTNNIRANGMPHGVIAHDPQGRFDIEALTQQAKKWAGLEGADLAKDVSTLKQYKTDEKAWVWDEGYTKMTDPNAPHVVVMDFGVKANILRLLASENCRISVVPAHATYEEITELNPYGVVLSNGPGDPAATGEYAVPVIRELIKNKIPTLGICLGHQMLALAVGAKTKKMTHGHHGANHPVKDHTTGKVEIVSMNHGFTVDETTLPDNVKQTHTSLFDGTNSGIELTDAPAFSVQHHPEASPGPQDSYYLFQRFVDLIATAKNS